MPLPSSGIIVVEKPSSASNTIINNSTTTINTVNNSSVHPPQQEQTVQPTQIQYYEYYDVNENQQQQQQKYNHQQQQQQQQQQKHSTIVVDGTIYHKQQQQQLQLGGSGSVAIGRKIHNSSSTSSTSSSTSSSSSSSSSTSLNKPNLHIQTLKTVPMPQTKQYSQQQQIIQHTSHTTTATAVTTNPQHHHQLHQQPQHVQQINLAASSIHHQTQHHHTQQQQPTPTAHMIQVSEDFLEQAANNHNTGNMMISTTGEVINQQQIFKIVSTDGTTGNMIIDATNQNTNTTTTTSKVLLSNLTVLSKQPTNAQGQIIGSNHQAGQTAGQTINFVNAKNLYTTSTAGGSIASGGKQQKFTVATANVANYKGSAIKQTSGNAQYLQQSNAIGQHKINMTAGNRNMQMLATARVQNAAGIHTTSNSNNNNNSNVALISNNAATAQTMVLQQQPQKFIANNTAGAKTATTALSSGGGNIIKKSTTAGTLRMNNSNNTSATTKLMNNLQTTQGVKTFITQTPCLQQQQQHTQQNINQLTLQHHTTKCGGKSKFAKQYNNAILNSAGAVAIATLPHQQSNSQNSLQLQPQQQQHQQLQPQTTYINHHKSSGVGGGSTKINKISSKYAQSVNVAAQLPPGTQLHQKSINQTQQQQFQTTGSNSNIKFVNAQGTIIQQQQQQHQPHQQQSLTSQKFNNKHHHQQQQQQQYQNLQNFDIVDGNHLYNQTTSPATTGATSSLSSASGTTSVSSATASASSLLTDDIMMVNGTQMTDELSARILQSMSQKSFSNQRYQQQQQHVFQTKISSTPPSSTSSSPSLSSNNNCNTNNNNNMLPPPPSAPQNALLQTNNNNSSNNNSNILLSPREYTLYPTTASASTIAVATPSQQQQQSSPIHYNNATNPTATASSNITAGSFSSNNYITVSNNNSNNMTTITPHTSGTSTANTLMSNNTSSGLTGTVRQAQSAPNSRSQSMERKLHESSMSRKSTEYYKVNNHNSLRGSHHSNLVTAPVAQSSGSMGMASASASNIMSGVVSTSIPPVTSSLPMPRPPSIPPSALIMEPQAQVIHLQATKTLPGANNSSNDDDDDIIGEEIRPAPVDTDDIRLRILHAVLFDHTYVNPMPLELPTTFAVQLPPTPNSIASALATSSSVTGHSQQWSLGGIGAVAAAAGTCGLAQQNYAPYGSQLSRLQQDEDSYSAISTGSRLAVGDIDPGEETETAPEAELEDDSFTRCICDLTHDDGYMICCDKCCAWQHVDCMGIDRQNIPDEYLCELCQPRAVDKARARSLQLMKRKEQQQQLMLTAQAHAAASAGTMGAAGSASGASVGNVANLLPNDVLATQQRLAGSTGAGFNHTGNMAAENAALQLLAAGSSNLKKGAKMLKKVKDGISGKRLKKAEKLAAAAAAAGLSASGKPARKEAKKNTKRKKAGGTHDSSGSTVGMTAAEKHAANLRQWIENYELAVTNHYSPELRARLHAITKQPSLLQTILNTENPILKEFSNGSLENRATTVPHAGGKILISNLDIIPNSPICELRGKYMLTTQYKTQNTSMNMNSPPPNNYHLASYKAHKTPGPFIFFYQLPGTEVTTSQHLMPQTTTTTTLNSDGTYTTTTTTLPAQQSPPTFLKGPEICVDTRTYGNEARFVRRSCRPNAEIQHLFEKGTIHLFIVALTDIRASTEITIRHEPHDLLAVENKKSSSMIIQPTSTPCACGLTKDCLFGPPLPQLPPAAKSNAGRKSLTHNGGGGPGNAGSLTAKQRKANQQNLNRNRSISSSASGDSNMGTTTTATTTTNIIAMGLNSPSNVGKIAAANKMVNTLMPLTASCNSNSSSSTLTSIMPDSGICTSSSSPSVSIPSPTQHMHSPIQQQQQQQQHQQQLFHNTQMRSPVQLLPQQQQLMQSLPTPLMLTTPSDMAHHPHQQQQQPLILQQPAMITQQQSLSVIAQPAATTATLNTAQDVFAASEQPQQSQPILCTPIQPATEQQPLPLPPPQAQTQQHQIQQQLLLQEQQHQVQLPASQHTPTLVAGSTALLETVSPEATIAAVALQSLNASHSPTVAVAATPSPVLQCPNVEPQQVQHQQFVLMPATEVTAEQLQQPQQSHEQNQTPENLTASASVPCSLSSSPQQQQQHQQTKSPQKNNHSQQNNTHPVRKTPGKHGRTTSFSEDTEQHHHNEDNTVVSTPTSSSTPKEKPKLSREDRKMEAILRAIEKMERSQQRKQDQNKTTKRQNSSSHNTTPTSPNKSFDTGENAGGSRRSNSHTGTAGRSKKKRKAGAKGGQGGSYSNQRKRRQSRMNSQESVDESSPHDHDAITSESDGCAALHSPPIQTMASARQSNFSTPTTSSAAVSGIATTTRPPNETITNNVDQAAGLLMAFANPNISPAISTSPAPTVDEQHVPESPQRSTSQYMISSNEAAAPSPPTPPSHVSSACLLIEAAVGPLESNLDGNSAEVHNSEFKYPLQAKTKKHLMNNWLHQAEENTHENNVTPLPEPASQSSQTPVTSVGCSGVQSSVPIVSGGLDSLLQAAMSDLKQSQTEVEQPQNLSIAAQKVEEFIQQTEASAGPTKHSYEYDQQQHPHQQRTYVNLPTPAVDLTLKTPLTIGPNPATSQGVTSVNRNFHLPLQVSTCSNNSSVKKRWLRQAISEETHEEFQNSFSMTPSPTTIVVSSSFAHTQLQPAPTCLPATTLTNHVPNGFTTPLKKRRLLLTGKDEVEENQSQNCGDLSANATPSPPPAPAPQRPLSSNQMEYSPLKDTQEEFEIKEVMQDIPSQDMHEDVDVDVEKCEISEAPEQQPQEQEHHLQYPKIEMDQEQDVDVTTSPQEDGQLLENQIKIETVIKHEDADVQSEVKEESPVTSAQGPAEFNDQEDDVDILRSPSPGREMIKAEDNLVKIEPEDTSGMEDVKIDVEREESMAADDVVVTQHKERKEEIIVPTQEFKEDEKINNQPPSSENVEIKQEVKLEMTKDDHVVEKEQTSNRGIEVVETERDNHANLVVKTEDESHTQVEQPKPKRLKLENLEAEEEKLNFVKDEVTKPETPRADEVNVKLEKRSKIQAHSKVCQRQELVVPHSTTNEVEKVPKTESAKIEMQSMGGDTAEVTSSSSSTLLAVRTVAADTTFADADASTPPPTTTIVGGTAAPIQRHKSLSDDDIQARLHSFHKENILFLQSRNKKTKSSSSTSANTNSSSSSTNCLIANNDHHKNRTSSSSSSSSNHQHHHNHHHHHEGKEKYDKSSSKHHKSSATPSSSSKKQKLHKRERTTSSSSSNSHKNSSTPQISSSSLLDKNAVINSTTNSTGLSKKLKSLKKSSSGSSTSSNTSTSSYSSSTLAVQNCYPSSSSTTATTSSDKEKHQRQRTTSSSSSSNNNVASSNSHATPTTAFPSSKKRQLNFELELTKDMHLLNNAISGGSKHKRDASRLAADEQGHVAAKKSRKETTSSQKDEHKNGANKQLVKIEKQHEKKLSNATAASSSFKGTLVPPISQPIITTATIPTPPISTLSPAPSEDPKLIPTIVTQPPPQPPLPPTTSILREHPTLPHFNNVVIATSCSSTTSHQQQQQPPLPSVQPQLPPPVLPLNIPNHVNSPSFISSVQSNHNQQQPPLPPTPPPSGAMSSPISTPNVSTTNHLPFYNTIYGKLLDNPAPPPNLPTPLTPSNTLVVTGTTPPPITASASVPAAGGVLSEYLDTKLKSYNTLGGYVSHTALFGLNNTANLKDSTSNAAVVSSTTISSATAPAASSTNTPLKDSSTDMPAPLAPPPAVCGVSVTLSPSCSSSGNSAATTTPLKIHTKTASHDPRLNPQLTAPEPPPQPKRKLSINEYRKRMQQSSSNDSISASSSLTSTPTTPPTPLETILSSSLLAPTTLPLTNKCTLNSPDRLTQSVDSQIQKEIMSSTTAVTSSSSSSDSLNSSNSSTSSTSLNDNLLKSSSFVEEDSTKGQFNAAPTLLEKQQESLCARLKSLKEKQSLGTSFSVGSGNRPRFSSFSENVAINDFGLRKDDDDMDIIRNRNHSISSSIGGGDLLDNCLEEISSTSTSMSSSREPSPERCYTTHHKILTASATTTMTNTTATSHSNNGQTTRHHQQQHHHTHHHQQQHINCDKSEMANHERKKSVDIA